MARAESPSSTLIRLDSGASFDATGAYRYRLWRRWAQGPSVCFIMLNPSTADAEQDDPTIRRCIRFARDWGYAALDVVNLFAYRATDPRTLRGVADPIGKDNARAVAEAVAAASLTVAAWGAWPVATHPTTDGPLHCLARNRDGSPKHPLYIRADATPVPWQPQSSN